MLGSRRIVAFLVVPAFVLGSHASFAARRPLPGILLAAAAERTSINWSGYNLGSAEKGMSFHHIAGDWVVPRVSAHVRGETESSSAWIGIGGGCTDQDCSTTDSSLIQAGTEHDVASDGTTSYFIWWEIIPLPQFKTSLPVKPGDRIHAAIEETSTLIWTVTVNNLTQKQSFSTTVPYSSTYGTAEWILETPLVVGSGNTGVAKMPNVPTMTFTNTYVNRGPARLAPSERVSLVDGTTVISRPSNPGPGATWFNVCTYAKTCAAPKPPSKKRRR